MTEANEPTQPSWIHEPPTDYSIKTLRDRHKKHSKLIKKRFDKFIKQNKDFGDDVWGLIKEYAIDKKYINSSFYEENTEVKIGRYIACECCERYNTPYTSVLIGKRFGNLLQIAVYRENWVADKKPIFKMFKTHIGVKQNGELMEICDDVKTGIWEYDDDFEEGEEYYDEEYEVMREYIQRPYQSHYFIPSTFQIKRLTNK